MLIFLTLNNKLYVYDFLFLKQLFWCMCLSEYRGRSELALDFFFVGARAKIGERSESEPEEA